MDLAFLDRVHCFIHFLQSCRHLLSGTRHHFSGFNHFILFSTRSRYRAFIHFDPSIFEIQIFSFEPQYYHATLDILRALTSRKTRASTPAFDLAILLSTRQPSNEHRSTEFQALRGAWQEWIRQAGQTNAGCRRASRTSLATPADGISSSPEEFLSSNTMASS